MNFRRKVFTSARIFAAFAAPSPANFSRLNGGEYDGGLRVRPPPTPPPRPIVTAVVD